MERNSTQIGQTYLLAAYSSMFFMPQLAESVGEAVPSVDLVLGLLIFTNKLHSREEQSFAEMSLNLVKRAGNSF